MSGDVKSKIDELEKSLTEYGKKFLLDKIYIDSEVEKILELRYEQLRVLPRETLFSYAFILVGFAAALQKEHNRQYAKKKWAEHNLNVIVAKEQGNYGDKYTKYEVRRSMIIGDNEYAKALNEIIVNSDVNIEELNFISSKINMMGEILREFGKTKRD